MIQQKIAEVNQQIKTLSYDYWKCKNLCACYSDVYGEWNDNQMIVLAKKAKKLGDEIRFLKAYKEHLTMELEDSLV